MENSYQFTIMTNNYQVSKKLALELKQKLEANNAKENELNPDIVFIIGGDGTFLKSVNKYNNQLNKIKFVTFKQGNIGFYHNFSVNDMDEFINLLFKEPEKLVINEVDLLEVEANNEIIYSVNEVRLVNFSCTLSFDVYINDELLQTFKGTGVVVSTKSGSTGLMKTTGAAIILANQKLMEYQEIFPVENNIYHSIKSPIILDDQQFLFLKLRENVVKNTNNDYLIIDTFNFHDKLIKEVKIKISSQSLKIFAFKASTNSLINRLNKSFIKFN